MQYMTKKNQQDNDGIIHVEENTDTDMVDGVCDHNKCYKRKHYNMHGLNELCVQNDNLCLLRDLVRPCNVVVRRLNLWGHNGKTLSACCHTFPDIMLSKESFTNKISNKLECGSVTKNRIGNFLEKNGLGQELYLLCEQLCKSFNSIEPKKKIFKETKTIDCDDSSSSSSESQGNEKIESISKQERNQIDETSKLQIMNSSLNCNTPSLSKCQSFSKKKFEKPNFKNINEKSKQSSEGNDSEIENEAPSHSDIKNMQTPCERYKNLSICEIPTNDCGLFVDRKNSYNVPLVDSVKICSKLKEDKTLETDVLIYSLNNSYTNYASNSKRKHLEKVKIAFYGNREEEIELLEEHVVQKNLLDSGTELASRNLVFLSNHKMKDIAATNSTLIETKEKFPDNIKAELIESSHDYFNKYLNVMEYKQTLHIKPCRVLLKNLDSKIIDSLYNTDITTVSEETNGNISQMGTANTDTSPFSEDLSTTPIEVDEFLNSNTEVNEQTYNIMPCFVLMDKLPIYKCLEHMYPNCVSSYHTEKAFYSVENVEVENWIPEEKHATCSGKSSCAFSDPTLSLTKSDQVSKTNASSKVTFNNEQVLKANEETPVVKPCSVFIENISGNNYENFVVPFRKGFINRINNVLKLNRKNNCKTSKRRKKTLRNHYSLNKKCREKIIDIFKPKKRKRRPKRFLKEKGKKLQLNECLNSNNCNNIDETLSTPLAENQHVCRISDDLLPKCPSDFLGCFVLLERMEDDDIQSLEDNNLGETQNDSSCTTNTLSDSKTHNDSSCATLSDLLPKCSNNNLITRDCFVSLQRMNVDDYFSENNIFNQCENPATLNYAIGNNYKTAKSFTPHSSINKLKRGRPLNKVDASILDVKRRKTKTKFSTVETGNLNNNQNFICDSNYKCCQCRKSITSDYELYHHLCCGKRKEGYICDFCERILKTIPRLKRHINFHFQ